MARAYDWTAMQGTILDYIYGYDYISNPHKLTS